MDTPLGTVFANLIESEKFSDCRIVVGPQTFDCHKVILASASEFFERMFLGDFKESKTGQFVLNDVKPEMFTHFLQYVYTYNKETLNKHSSKILMDLLVIGIKWLVPSIQSDCVALLKERAQTMVLGDLVELFQAAHNLDNKVLIDSVKMHLRNRFGSSMNCYDILMLTSDVFEQYLIVAEDYIEEVERFKMIEAYVTVNGLHDAGMSEDSEYAAETEAKAEAEAETNKVENSDVGETKDVTTSVSTLAEIMPAEGEELASSKQECDVKQMGRTVTKMSQLHVGDQKENRVKAIQSKYVRILLGYIKYEKMNKNEFYKVVGKSTLLNYKEKFENLYKTQWDDEQVELE